ncbi:MAG TPA: hypothetical protein GXX36_01755 [Clostridiaceae bacterium]|nr:hypothetical protein [Clostridiaceae bacterium]
MVKKSAEHINYNKNIVWHIVSAAAGVLAILLILLSTSKFGPGISADSVAYMHAARSLAGGDGFVYFGFNAPFIQWPPLYPSLLSLAELFRADIWAAANYLNAIILGLIIFISGMWLSRNLKNGVYVLWGLGAMTFSVPLLYVSRYVWSEPLFILLLLLFIIEMEKYFKTQKFGFLLLSAVFAALACMTRYIGVVLILTGAVVILLQYRKFVDKLCSIFVFGLISGLPLGIWAVRNYIVSRTIFGARTPSMYTLKQNIVLTIKTLASWALPLNEINGILGDTGIKLLKIAFAAFCLIFAVLLVWLVLKNWPVAAKSSKEGAGQGKSLLPVLVTPVLFVMFYTVYLIGTATAVAFDSIDSRLLSPVFVPLIMIAAVILDSVTQYLKQSKYEENKYKEKIYKENNYEESKENKAVRHTAKAAGYTAKSSGHANKAIGYILAVLMLLWLACPASSAVKGLRHLIDNGAGGFNTVRWHSSSMIKLLRENPLEGNIYSNCPDAIYALTDKFASYTPRKNSLEIYGFERFREAVQGSGASYIVWFDKYSAGLNYSIEELSGHYNLEKIAETEEGKIYRLYAQN